MCNAGSHYIRWTLFFKSWVADNDPSHKTGAWSYTVRDVDGAKVIWAEDEEERIIYDINQDFSSLNPNSHIDVFDGKKIASMAVLDISAFLVTRQKRSAAALPRPRRVAIPEGEQQVFFFFNVLSSFLIRFLYS